VCIDSTPLKVELKELYDVKDEYYDFLLVFSKKLSEESLKTLNENLEFTMTRLNSTQFQYTLQPFE